VVIEELHPVELRVIDEESTPVPDALILRCGEPDLSSGTRMLMQIVRNRRKSGGGSYGGVSYEGTSTGPDGRCVFCLTRKESIEVAVCPPGRQLAGNPKLTTISGEAGGVTVVMPRGRDLSIRIAGWRSGMNGYLYLRSAEDDDCLLVHVKSDGTAVAPHVAIGKPYTLYGRVRIPRMKFEDGDLFVYGRGVTVQEEPVELRIETGEAIIVRVRTGGDDVRNLHVVAIGHGVRVSGLHDVAAGVWRFRGLPSGMWTVEARGACVQRGFRRVPRSPSPTHAGTVKARTGDTVELTLAPIEDE